MILSRRVAFFVLCCLVAPQALAQGFAVLASPPRIEARVQPGDTYRNIIELTNVSQQATPITVRTADWTLEPAGTAAFDYELAADSCRPWVGIEARELTLPPQGKRRFRFEAKVPDDAERGECRFAVMFEGDAETAPGDVPVPVSGRLGIIVYLTIGDAEPFLSLNRTEAADVQGTSLPVLTISNTGDAHGRLEGFIDGTDAGGTRFTFSPSTTPIMPGETRPIALSPVLDDSGSPAPAIQFPLTLKGHLENGKQRLEIETVVAP